jgi:hypothetical protein
MALLTSNDILNRSLIPIGDNVPAVTGKWPNFDSTAAGRAGNTYYQDVVQTVGRKFSYDFSRTFAALVPTVNTPPMGFAYEYPYPAGIQIRQLVPAAAVLTDLNDPLPQDWVVGFVNVAGTPTKVIWSNLQNAQCEFTGLPPENLWDPLFVEEVVRLLGSVLAMGLEGRPETAQALLESYVGFEQSGMQRLEA